MKKKFFILIFGICVLISLFYLITRNQELTFPVSYDKSVLEVQKLQIDVSYLQNEQKYQMLKFWLSNLTPIAALFTLIWTVYAGLKTINNQTNQKKKDAISSLLQAIASDSPDLRLGSARGLSSYVNEALDEIISVATHEHENIVRDELEKILYNINGQNLNKLLELNSSTIAYRIVLLGKMKELSLSNDIIYAITHIPIDILHTFIKVQPFKVSYEHSKKLQLVKKDRLNIINKYNTLTKPQLNISDTVINDAKISAQLAEITGRVLAKALCKGKKLSLPALGIDLSETTLYEANLNKTRASNVITVNCLMRHAKLEKSVLSYSFFDNSDLYGISLNKSTFKNVSFKVAHLRGCVAKRIKLLECNMNNAILSEGNLSGSLFSHTTGKSTQFRASNLKDTVIEECNFSYCEFQNGNFKQTFIKNSKFYSCNFIEANFMYSTIKDIKFNGSDFRGAKFNNCIITNVDFSGANIDKADFRGMDASSLDFSKSKGTPIIDVPFSSTNSTNM